MKPASNSAARTSRLLALLQRIELTPSWLRFGSVTTVLAAVSFISLSDKVGASYTKPIGAAKNFVGALVPGSGLSPVGAVDLPVGIDTLGHFVLWGCVGFVASLLITVRGDRLNVLSALWALSAIIEVAQKYLSYSRHAQLSDLLANGTGLIVGSLAAAMALAWTHKVAARQASISRA